MRNEHSTSGAGEDIIRAFVQFGATEMHLKTLYEKTLAEMENGIIDVADADVLEKQIEKLDGYREDLIEVAQLRRRTMLVLFNMFDGDKDAWCLVKHLGIGCECAFEAWQASDNDAELLDLWIESNKAFTKAVTRFLGMTVGDCSACLSDALKAKE